MQRPSRQRTLAGLFLVVGITMGAFPAIAGGMKWGKGEDCIPKVEGWLQEAGVDMATVDSIKVDAQVRRNNDGDKRFQGWQGWVRFKNRDGAVVFSMRRNCDLVSSWTKGDIEWAGPGAT